MADWSDADIRTVKAMWRKGATATVIAEALGEGFTRGSVLGKIHRLGLKKADEAPKTARPVAKPASAKSAKPAAKRAAPVVGKVARGAAPILRSQPKPAPARAPVQTKPAQAAPAQAKPVQVRPSQVRPSQVKPDQAKPAHAKPVQTAPAENKPVPAKPPIQVKPVEKPRIVARAPEPAGPMPIWALGQCQCRWPIGNLLDPPGLFCAAVTADGSSWCPVHERMVYTGSNRPRPEAARELPRFAVAGGRSRF